MAHCVPLPSSWIPARRSLVPPSGPPTLVHRKSSWMGRVCPKYSSPRRCRRGHPACANDSTRPAAPPLPLKNTRVKHTCLVTVCLGSFGAQMPANRHVADQTGPPARRTRAIDAPFCKGFGGEYGPHRGKRQLKWSRCYSTTTTWANAAITAALRPVTHLFRHPTDRTRAPHRALVRRSKRSSGRAHASDPPRR